MRLDDLAIRTQTPIDTDTVLFEKFKSHERVEFDPKTNLYSFKASLPYALLSSRPDTQSSMTTVFGAKRPCLRRFNVRRDAAVESLCELLKSHGRMHPQRWKNSRRKGRCSSHARLETARCVWYFGTS